MSSDESILEFEWTENVGIRLGANLSKRELFAGIVLHSIIGANLARTTNGISKEDAIKIYKSSIETADAFLAILESNHESKQGETK